MELKDIKELYGATVRFSEDEKEMLFTYSTMPIRQHYNTILEMVEPYLITKNYSTRCFGEHMLDKEYKITDEFKVFYSASKENCIEWLRKEREKTISFYKRILESLERSKIEDTRKRWERLSPVFLDKMERKQDIKEYEDKNVARIPVRYGFGISPYCPHCSSGEYLYNEDGNENDYCGQCGTKLGWDTMECDDCDE